MKDNLDRQIVIQSISRTQNTAGEMEETTATFDTVWANILYIRGDESQNNQMQVGRQFARFRIRHIAGLKMEMRISYDSLIWDITEIRPIGRNEGIDIIAIAVRN